jgi:glycine/D-amino acid oxidase-like deaminating enzyme/nitrite reductase/ring-hydroxylating ferredoxin subunit
MLWANEYLDTHGTWSSKRLTCLEGRPDSDAAAPRRRLFKLYPRTERQSLRSVSPPKPRSRNGRDQMAKMAARMSRSSESVWINTVKRNPAAPLEKSAEADVCIVGAGMAGMSAAYELAREGKSVIVLEKSALDFGETPRTSAHLSNVLDAKYKTIAQMHGEDGARKAAESHSAAISEIEAIAAREGIDCEFKRTSGYLFLAEGDSESTLKDEFDASRNAGLSVERSSPPLRLQSMRECLKFPDQAQFHPVKYLAGLDAAIQRLGAHLYSQTEVTEIVPGKITQVETNRGSRVSAGSVIVATNTPVNDWVKMHTKQAAYRTYVVGMAIDGNPPPPFLYWDTAEPFHYVRTEQITQGRHVENLLIVGGEDHKTGQEGSDCEQYTRLANWAKEYFPDVGAVKFRWSGQIINSMDGLAFIGRNPGDKENIFIVTGDSGNGLTHGTIAGMLLRDLILGRKNPWTDLYDPSRKNLRSVLPFARENLNVALEYSGWLGPGEVDDESKIKPGAAAIIRRGLSKIAVYRDSSNQLHELSAVCTHLGCIVAWNALEQSWDCPCHGSRFSPDGKVLNGPAVRGLDPVGDEARK